VSESGKLQTGETLGAEGTQLSAGVVFPWRQPVLAGVNAGVSTGTKLARPPFNTNLDSRILSMLCRLINRLMAKAIMATPIIV